MLEQGSHLVSVAKLALAVLLCLQVAVLYNRRRKKLLARLSLPPGPPAHWLFGNEFPRAYAHRTFLEWSKLYGPVFSLRKGSNLTVVICGHEAAVDIMEKENALLVDRPRTIGTGEIMSGGMRTVLIGQGDRFRKFRKALQSQLNIKVVEIYEPVQERAAKNVILDILSHPENHIMHVKRYAASVIMSLAYGKTTPTSYSDPEVLLVNKCLTRLSKAQVPGRFLVDSYPVLRYVPGLYSDLYKAHREELSLFRSQLEIVREKMHEGDASPSFAKYILEKQSEYSLSDDELAYLAGSMFGAGSDTSASAITIIIMAAARFPDAQRRVQKQLDAVVGRKRVPSFSDMNRLVEVTAFVLESYRWRPVSLGFAHRATKDIMWGQYCIPEGATVLGSHWAIAHDPEAFPDPDKFLTSRWILENGDINERLKSFSFGFGRRVCPGQHVANRSLFINTAMLLWAFDISEDPAKPIDDMAFTDAVNNHPLPFKVHFKPRIDNLKDLINSSLL